MELKKTKNKPKSILVKTSKLDKKTKLSPERTITETLENVGAVVRDSDEVIIIENNNEAIFTEKTGEQSEFLRISPDIQKESYKVGFKNILENKKRLFLALVPWVLILIFLVSSFYLWSQLSDIKKDPLKAAQAEVNEVTKSVGRIMILPDGEIPKVATLTDTDLSKVKTQSFFVNAKVGDKVLVYSIARKVILYNPSLDKIVEVANLNPDNGSVPLPSL